MKFGVKLSTAQLVEKEHDWSSRSGAHQQYVKSEVS